MSIIPGEHSELCTFDGDRSPNSSLKKFLRDSFGKHYTTISVDNFKNTWKHNSKKTKFTLIGGNNIPVIFLYFSSYYWKHFDF